MKKKSVWSIFVASIVSLTAFAGPQANAAGYSNYRMYSGLGPIISDSSFPAGTINTVIVYYTYSLSPPLPLAGYSLTWKFCRKATFFFDTDRKDVCNGGALVPLGTGTIGTTFKKTQIVFAPLPADMADGTNFVDDTYYVSWNIERQDGKGVDPRDYKLSVYGVFTGVLVP